MSLALTVGPVTDYLYGLAQAAVAGVSMSGEAAVAVDGEPNSLSNLMFIVGLDNPPADTTGTTTGTVAAIILGGSSAQEAYDVPCLIDVRVGGTAQKTARDLAEAMFNPFWNALMADRSLGGLLHGGGAQLANVTSTPRMVGSAAESGRRQLMTFSVRCTDLQLA